eukprot:scaffold55953_cov21-Tisochrysis_lutea.AAC.2
MSGQDTVGIRCWSPDQILAGTIPKMVIWHEVPGNTGSSSINGGACGRNLRFSALEAEQEWLDGGKWHVVPMGLTKAFHSVYPPICKDLLSHAAAARSASSRVSQELNAYLLRQQEERVKAEQQFFQALRGLNNSSAIPCTSQGHADQIFQKVASKKERGSKQEGSISEGSKQEGETWYVREGKTVCYTLILHGACIVALLSCVWHIPLPLEVPVLPHTACSLCFPSKDRGYIAVPAYLHLASPASASSIVRANNGIWPLAERGSYVGTGALPASTEEEAPLA